MLAIGRAPSPADAHEPSLGRPPDRPPDFRCHPHPQDGLTALIVEQKLAHRGFIMANGLIRLSGTGSELLQRLEIRALPIWKADGEVSLSCGTTPLRVVPVHGPIPRYVAILRWTQISFIRLLWLWAHVRRGASCDKVPGFARNFPMTSRQNQPTIDLVWYPACWVLPLGDDPRGLLMKSLKLIGLALGASFALSASAFAQDITIAVAGPMTGGESAFGRQMKNGAEQAVADINAAGGVLGKKLALQIGDDACDPKQARSVGGMVANRKQFGAASDRRRPYPPYPRPRPQRLHPRPAGARRRARRRSRTAGRAPRRVDHRRGDRRAGGGLRRRARSRRRAISRSSARSATSTASCSSSTK